MSRFGFLNEGNNSVTGVLPLDFYHRKASERIILGIGRLSIKGKYLIQPTVCHRFSLPWGTSDLREHSGVFLDETAGVTSITINAYSINAPHTHVFLYRDGNC